MEPQGYLNPENEEKAEEIRKLVYKYHTERDKDRKILINKAGKLSNELEEYLENKYPNNFKIIVAEMNLNTEIPEGNPIKFLKEIFTPNFDEIPLHFIIIFNSLDWDFSRSSSFPDAIYKIRGVLFQNDNESDFIKLETYNYNELKMPDSFYDFLERMGLFTEQAAELYKLENVRPNNKYHRMHISGFKLKKDQWPLKVKIMEKI